MFDNLRKAFREAVENFHQEVNRDQVPEVVDSLVRGMEREAVDAKAALDGLKRDLERARKAAEAEGREAETCRRREAMARGIGDEETAKVAAEFGAKHADRHRVLSKKADAVEAEVQLRGSEYREMLKQIKESRAKRSAMTASAGRTQARSSLSDPDDLFGEFDRMAEKAGDQDARSEGTRARPEGARDAASFDRELDASRRERTADVRLEELKRRMRRK